MANKKGSIATGRGDGFYYVIYIRDCVSVGTGEAFQVISADISYCAFGVNVAPYLSGSEKQINLEEALKAEGANKEAIMREQEAIEKLDITNKTSDTEVPAAVKKIVFKDITTVKLGDIYTTNANGVYYVIYVTGLGSDGVSASILYKEFKSDLFYSVTDSLISGLSSNKVYPAVKSTAPYSSNAAAGTFNAWISETKNGTLEPARNEFDTNMFTGTDDQNNTVYNAYIVINKPMYIDTYDVVDGAYLRITESSKGANDVLKKATELEKKLNAAIAEGKTGQALVDVLKSFSAATQVDVFSKNTIAGLNTEMGEWMFDDARVANEFKIFAKDGETNVYVALYLASYPSWYAKAEEDYITTRTTDWLAELTQSYSVNQKAMDRIGDPTTAVTTATTAPKQ